jgi:N-formylglutamate amidohydrolase
MIVDVNRREDGMQKHAETLMTETGLQAESLEISVSKVGNSGNMWKLETV